MPDRQRVHFVGIGGIHMSGLARILLADGAAVSGCDLTPSHLIDELRRLGAEIAIGHDAAHVQAVDLVVRTTAVPEAHPEIRAARLAGVELITRAEMVARVAAGRTTLTVAGSHGKTTTATMLTLILRQAGRDPSFLLGGESAGLGAQAARGGGEAIVLEADEYGRAFLAYRPSLALITNLERDHLDYYGSDEALAEAFRQYAQTLRLGGTLIVGGESACAMRVAEQVTAERRDIRRQTFGIGPGFDWAADDVAEQPSGATFHLRRGGESLGPVALGVAGAHNVRNATAAIAVALQAGAGIDAARRALAAFRGVARRFDLRAEIGGVIVLDDYAHHPTEIAATIATARARYPDQRLVVLFQPHTYSRSSYLLDGFQSCFQGVDALYLTDTYAAREQPEAGLTAVDLAARLTHPGAVYLGSLDEAIDALSAALSPNDVVITMGAGDIARAAPAIVERLERS